MRTCTRKQGTSSRPPAYGVQARKKRIPVDRYDAKYMSMLKRARTAQDATPPFPSQLPRMHLPRLLNPESRSSSARFQSSNRMYDLTPHPHFILHELDVMNSEGLQRGHARPSTLARQTEKTEINVPSIDTRTSVRLTRAVLHPNKLVKVLHRLEQPLQPQRRRNRPKTHHSPHLTLHIPPSIARITW